MVTNSPKLLLNAVFIPEDNLYLVSTSADESVVHYFNDGLVLALKGGTEYALRGGDYIKLDEQGRYVEWILTDQDSAEWIAERMLVSSEDGWGLVKDESIERLKYLCRAILRSDEPLYKVCTHWIEQKELTELV